MEFTSNASTQKDEASEVVITVSNANYNDFTFTLTIKATDKESVTLTGLSAEANLVYTGTPQNGYTGTLVAKQGTAPVEIGTPKFTYMGINGTNYSGITPPSDAGSYNLVVSVSESSVSYYGNHEIITFTIEKAPITVTQGSYTITKPWDGTDAVDKVTTSGALTVTGVVNSETVSVTATPQAYPRTEIGEHNVVADLAITNKNYKLKNSTVNIIGKITKADAYTGIEANDPSVTPTAKSENSITLQRVSVDGEIVEYAKSETNIAPTTGWQEELTFTGLEPATEYYFFARVKSNNNHPEGRISKGSAISTEKSKYPNIPTEAINIFITNEKERTGKITLGKLLGESNVPDGAEITNIKEPNTKKVLETLTINQSTKELEFTSKNNPKGTSATDAFTIQISSTKYKDINLVVIFNTIEKKEAHISATMSSKEYDGKAMTTPSSITATVSGQAITLDYTYQWKKGSSDLDKAPSKAGEYQIVITGSNDDYTGKVTIPFVISPKPLTIKAEDKSVVYGEEAPEYTNTVTGLVVGESLSEVSYSTSYNKDNLDSSLLRISIVPSKGKVSSGNENYTIKYEAGTLTITPNAKTIEHAIEVAKAAKEGIIISEKSESQIEQGKRFVTATVMSALDRAITVAIEAKNNASTQQELADALAAITEATKTFKDAIQTGKLSSSGGGGGNWSPPSVPKPNPEEQEKPNTDEFTDITGHWAEESIKFVVEENLFKGISETNFSPDTNMDRGMLISVLGRMAKIDTSKYKNQNFSDVSDSQYYAAYIAWATEMGIVKGTSDDTFSPESAISRQELAVMLVNYAKFAGLTLPKTQTQNFADQDNIAPWAMEAMDILHQAGILTGRPGNLAEPNATATRAEVATLLERFVELLSK